MGTDYISNEKCQFIKHFNDLDGGGKTNFCQGEMMIGTK